MRQIFVRIRQITAVLLFNIAAIVVMVEGVLWLVMIPCQPAYYLEQHYPHRVVTTCAGPISETYTTNSQGFHDIEQPFEKPAGELRIVTIGDSFLEGPQQTPLPGQLRQNLADNRINVVNLSRTGINVNLYYLLFKQAVADYDPDIIMVFIFEGNDFKGMENHTPAQYDEARSLFRRYPLASYYGSLFPRSTIFLSCLLTRKPFLHRWTPLENNKVWTDAYPVRDLWQIARIAAKTVQIPAKEIHDHLRKNLSDDELLELTSYGVRLDVISYMLGVALKRDAIEELPTLKHRPEIVDDALARRQVQSVFEFLRAMQVTSTEQGIEFHTVLIPSFVVDAACLDLYTRLGAQDDPMFAKRRAAQSRQLRELLTASNIPTYDLREHLTGESGLYLKFDTHWTVKGVQTVARYIQDYLNRNSEKLAGHYAWP